MDKKKIFVIWVVIVVMISAFQGYVYGLLEEECMVLSTQEKQIFNKQFDIYEGEKVAGSSVKTLIETIIASNNNNYDKINKFVGINFLVDSDIEDEISDDLCPAYYDVLFTQEQIKTFANSASKLKKNISTAKNYAVSMYIRPETGLISEVTIIESGLDEKLVEEYENKINERHEKIKQEYQRYIEEEERKAKLEEFTKYYTSFIAIATAIIVLIVIFILIKKHNKKKKTIIKFRGLY